ncbi:MAG: nitroreductase family protein [Acidimicrobiia bacterium]
MPAPMIPHQFDRLGSVEQHDRADSFYEEMNRRRSVRFFSDEPVARHLIEQAIRTASTAPSGAHRQPWTFVLVGDPDLKRQIREAAEEEERINYEGGRLPEHWREALEPLGTDWHKEFLETVPWIVVMFEQRYGVGDNGEKQHHFYVKESCGIAAGIFIAALHHMGLATLTHTPSPMKFLTNLLDRPENERPFCMFPIGYPADACTVPDLRRKDLSEVLVEVDSRHV